MRRYWLVAMLLPVFSLLLLGAAAVDDASPSYQQATQRPFRPVDMPTATAQPDAPCLPLDPAVAQSQHIVAADVDYSAKSVSVQQRIQYANRSGLRLDALVLNVEANRWPNIFALDRAQVNGVDVAPALVGKRLTLPLPQPLLADCQVDVSLSFRLALPRIGVEVYSAKGYLGYSDRQMNLGHWLPTVASLGGEDWISRGPSLIGEQEVLEMADWQVTLTLVNAPTDLLIAAPGQAIQLAPAMWRYSLRDARDFSLSLSDQYRVLLAGLPDGTQVEVYSFDTPELAAAAEHALIEATQALDTYANLYGPYLYRRLLVIQGDFPDGMEFSGLVFVGDRWFSRWDGSVASYLTLITVHEVAHQWWYASVGNDPALTPWLDEALATYSEYVYLETYHPDLKDWWWDFRVRPYAPQGFVDGSVYEYESARDYINAVYLRGVSMLHELRADLGTEPFFDWLAAYSAAGAGQIADPTLFWSLLTPQQWTQTQATRDRYLRQPNLGAPG